MKKLYAFIFLSFLYFATFSQIVIEGSGFIQPNTTLSYETVAAFNADALINTSGQNASWNIENWNDATPVLENYVSLENLSVIIQMNFFNQTLNPIWYSTHALEGELDLNLEDLDLPIEITEPRLYFRTDETGYYNTGLSFTAMGLPMVTKNEIVERIFKFPMHYGDVDTSALKFLIAVPLVGSYGQSGTRSSLVDGEGVLVTPYGSYQTLRVKSIIHITDTIESDYIGGGQSFIRPEQINYTWLSPDVKGPVLEIVTSQGEIISSKLFVEDVTSAKSLSVQNQVNLYPNPATDFVYIESPFAEKANVKLYDLQGKLVLNQQVKNQKIDVSKLPAGMYIVNILDGNDLPDVKRLVIE